MTPTEIERWAHARQRAHGAAAPVQTGAGYSDSQTQAGTKIYMRRLNDGYDELQGAIVDLTAKAPPKTDTAWQYVNRWFATFGAWKKFYADTIDDIILTTDDEAEATDYGDRLAKARADFKGALGKNPPGSSVPKQPTDPKTPAETAAGALSSLVTVAELGIVGFIVYKAVQIFVPAKKKGSDT